MPTTCAQSQAESAPWWRLDLQRVRLLTSVRVQGRFDEGRFEVRVGLWPKWEYNPACASGLVPRSSSREILDVACHAEGRYAFFVAVGLNRSFSLCEVNVFGLPPGPIGNQSCSALLLPNCTSCAAGTFKDSVGSEACTACAGGKYSTATGAQEVSSCQSCRPGETRLPVRPCIPLPCPFAILRSPPLPPLRG